MKIIFLTAIVSLFVLSLFFVACTGQNNKLQTAESDTRVTDSSKAILPPNTGPVVLASPAITDSGKPYFKVAVYKNNQPSVSYEGDWAIALSSGDLFNIQFAASKRALKTSHLLILYFNGASTGTFPVVASGNEKGKPTLVFIPEVNGNYGVGMSLHTGRVVISKFSNKTVSGTIDAEGKNESGEVVKIKAAFANIKNNNAEE